MIWMETYLFYCSVRLGVMIISVLSFISLLIPAIIILVMGSRALKPILKLLGEDEHFKNHFLIKLFTAEVENDSDNVQILLVVYFFAHMTACLLAFYGSLKLKKYFILPIIFFELWRVGFCLTFHIVMMIVAKAHINLGILITVTLAGGFVILFLAYNWAACVALYQIINLVNSERYRALYGDDPFTPLIPKTVSPMVTENIRVLITPTTHDIDEQKNRNTLRNVAQNNRALQPQAIISVLPVDYLENNSNAYRNNLKWKESQWPTTTVKTPPMVDRYTPSPDGFATLRRYNRNDNYELNYNNWQWSELAPAVSARNKNNIYLQSNWKY